MSDDDGSSSGSTNKKHGGKNKGKRCCCKTPCSCCPGKSRYRNVVEIIECDGRFTQFVALLRRTGVYCTVAESAAQTVFAPTDEAFCDLPSTVHCALRHNEMYARDVALYHLLCKQMTLNQLVFYIPNVLETKLDDAFVEITLELTHTPEAAVLVNDAAGSSARIVEPDWKACNGVVHVINNVLLPYLP